MTSDASIHDEYEFLRLLGSGAYGRVHLAQHWKTRKLYAIKSLPQSDIDDRQRRLQRSELILHAKLRHPNVIRLERILKDQDAIYVVMEYGPEGDLFSAITERNLYYGNHALIKAAFLQLLDAVQYCHDQRVYHRDLKPENILVFENGRVLKLADFGLATCESVAKDYGCGSTFYFSPECQGDVLDRSTGYATAPNDIWSLGVILINLATGKNPWRQACLEDEAFRSYLADRDYLLKMLPISRGLNQILRRIFCIDPARRISLKDLKEAVKRCRFFTRTSHQEEDRRPKKVQDIFPPSPPPDQLCFSPSLSTAASSSSSLLPHTPIKERTSFVMLDPAANKDCSPDEDDLLPSLLPAS